jgi:hypothetical protein
MIRIRNATPRAKYLLRGLYAPNEILAIVNYHESREGKREKNSFASPLGDLAALV